MTTFIQVSQASHSNFLVDVLLSLITQSAENLLSVLSLLLSPVSILLFSRTNRIPNFCLAHKLLKYKTECVQLLEKFP